MGSRKCRILITFDNSFGLIDNSDGQNAVFFDGPAGSQVPVQAADEVRRFMLHPMRTKEHLPPHEVGVNGLTALGTMSTFYGDVSPNIVFGANMTTLTPHFTRSVGRPLPEDEIIVSGLDQMPM